MVAPATAQLARQPGLVARARASLVGAVERVLGVGVPIGARSGAPLPVSAPYPVDMSERAFLSNPWVWACIQAISTDLSGLPLVAETGSGADRVQSADHELLYLLDHPHPKVGGRKFRKQLVADLLGGNSYTRVWRRPDRSPAQLGRIPPDVIQPLVGLDAEEVGWKLTLTGETLPWDAVLHVGDISLSSQPDLVLGSSPVQPLALGLQVDRDARRMAGRAAKRGRLEMMLSPNGENARLGEERVKGLVDAYAVATEQGHGIYVPGVGMTATPLSLTARDAEYLGERALSRQEVLAAYGVPETRVGSPAANYGTAREQSRIYWQSLQARAALIDDELSRLAEPGTRIRHDFSSVDALQPSRSERLARVLQLVSLGMDPNEALRYEGFVDAPFVKPAAARTSAPGTPSSTGVDEPRKNAAARVGGALRLVAGLLGQQDEDDESIKLTAKCLLARTLEDLGAKNADAVAAEATAWCAEAVRSVGDDCDNVVDLRAFGGDHVERILRVAGLREAA